MSSAKLGNPRRMKKRLRRQQRGELSLAAARRIDRVAERYGTTCWICKTPINMKLQGTRDPLRPTLEHKLPVSRGGTNDPGNLRLTHSACNNARGNRLGKGPAALLPPMALAKLRAPKPLTDPKEGETSD